MCIANSMTLLQAMRGRLPEWLGARPINGEAAMATQSYFSPRTAGCRLMVLAAIAIAAAFLPATAGAKDGAALVMAVKGAIAPALQPYREIPKNTTVVLKNTAELTFVHYHTCRRMTVAGPAEVFVGFASVKAPTENVVASRRLKKHCVSKAKRRNAKGGKAAVLVMRSTPRRVSTKPEIVLTGNIDRVSQAVVSKDGQEIQRFDKPGVKIAWPDTDLAVGAAYEIALHFADGEPAARYSLIPNSEAADDQIILLSVD